jgi:hypothetical protein
VADARQISYPEAVYKIDEYVQKLHARLEEKQTISLENLGSFTLSSEDSLQFEPVAETNYLTEAFGLNKVPAIEVKREVLKKQVEELEEKTPILFTPERRQS